MDRVGDELAGYTIDHDASNRIVRVRSWGFWNADIAAAFGKDVGEACKRAPQGTSLLIDVKELKPMPVDGQASFGVLFGTLRTLRVSTTIAAENTLTRLQLLRLANQHAGKDAVHFVYEGVSNER